MVKSLENLKYFNSVAKMSEFNVLNSKFTRGRCRIMYTGRNRNYTDITEDALNKLIERKGYANVPVVAHLYKGDDGKWRVGGHDSKFVITAEGFEIIDETIPFGTIPEDCNPAFEEITEPSGEVKKYFCVDIILWTHRYNIMDAAKSDELWFNQSMEININHCDYDRDDYCIIDDFDLSALCLLNHDPYNKENEVEPCFPSAGVNKFSIDKLKQEFKNMYVELNNFMSVSDKDTGFSIDAVKALSDIDYLVFTDYLWDYKKRRSTDRYYGLMFDSSELEKILKNKYFAVNTNGNGTKAVIFSSEVECNLYCTFASEYRAMDFEGFKDVTNGKWENSSYYHPQKNDNCIIYTDGSRYDLEDGDLL